MLNIVGKKNTYFVLSAILILTAIVGTAIFGLKEGIDFRGGTLWQFSISETTPKLNELENFFQDKLGLKDIKLSFSSNNETFLARLPETGEEDHQKFFALLRDKFPSLKELVFQSIGPSVGKELRESALRALILTLIGISLYIAFAFRKVSRPVSSWKYGVVTLFTLFHDVVIPVGLLAFLGRYLDIEIDTNFAVALLVVAGFSVHDTIVVFDRIRESLSKERGNTPFETIVNQSVNQTIVRSVNTSLTLILVLIALLLTGPQTLHYFVLTLLTGVVTGIYSSIFIASPLLVVWHNFGKSGVKAKR